jgi:hypothetical protein
MRRVTFWVLILITTSIASAQQSNVDQKQMKWIDGVLRTIATIKPGMLRKDLSSVFRLKEEYRPGHSVHMSIGNAPTSR